MMMAQAPKSTGGAMQLAGGGEVAGGRRRHHFVLVHGLCDGAWCWYKVATALDMAATALDMAASGAHPACVDEVRTFEEYSRPLLDALAAERFPERLAAVVFLTAGMPSVGRPMSTTTEEDLTLALSLIRPTNKFTGDALMGDAGLLTKERYGSVRRVFVVVEDDRCIPVEFQRRMVAQNPGVEVVDLAGADHMAMISTPAKFAEELVRIAGEHSNLARITQ